MNEDELQRFLAKEANALDHLTRKIHGPGVKFESLSAFGQNTIEKLVREHALVSDPNPDVRQAKIEAMELRRENTVLVERLSTALKENQDLWEENEELKVELYDKEEDNISWRERFEQEQRVGKRQSRARSIDDLRAAGPLS